MANRNAKTKEPKGSSKGMTEYILSHPISCGYLLVFSEAEHNAENLNFIMEIDKFKDQYTDQTCWSKDWVTIDASIRLGKDMKDFNMNLTKEPAPWPSRVINRDSILHSIDDIWRNYLSDDSPTQICLSMEILKRTRIRIELIHLYGSEVFGECLLDPIKTINRDILPRFMKSEIYRVLNTHLASADPLPLASTLHVPPPERSVILDDAYMDALESKVFTLEDMLTDVNLYEEFLLYLRRQYSSENLLCVRMIHMFEEKIGQRTPESEVEANNQAWEIYKYFVAPGSAFEVSCSFRVRKEVMLNLSKSSPGDFDKVKRSAMGMLNVNFESFQGTQEYADLKLYLRQRKNDLKGSLIGNAVNAILGGKKKA